MLCPISTADVVGLQLCVCVGHQVIGSCHSLARFDSCRMGVRLLIGSGVWQFFEWLLILGSQSEDTLQTHDHQRLWQHL